ncbi:PBECR2 nuclease fold domain-containing protein [Comamonas aquatica]|uniref:PBECR2 nuclease fold domain-containing protein n=1 Tax=Comamonas aquatica TaxID=225991 RepID=UPI002449C6B8|nr:PBECR2 nuclease fold domain-containing protein [Comamonas aquatica]MDH0494256.1 PBECR2 nuclease fold domain-containing protein [Comamonas aquatica]
MADAAPSAAYGSLPFAEQNAFFRRKLNLPTQSWTDIYTAEHDWAFVVAGANRNDLVTDFRAAVEKAIEGGGTLEDFRKDFDRIVARHGWDYHGGRNWRSKVIYETNLATSYAAGRWEQLQAAPYWQYQHSDWVQHPREQHVAWDNLLLSKDDPWWRIHFPPNGWGCQCSVKGLWPHDLERMGKNGPDTAPEIRLVEHTIGKNSPNGPRTVQVPEGIAPGFEYAPGANRLRSAIPPAPPAPRHLPAPPAGVPNAPVTPPLPPARAVPPSAMPAPGLSAADAAAAFLRPLGATLTQPAVVRDVVGERLVVGAQLLQTAEGAWATQRLASVQDLPLLAHALLQPDEIWTRIEYLPDVAKAVVRRRYLARLLLPGNSTPVLAVVEVAADGWQLITVLDGARTASAQLWRQGVLLYQRED